jgi:hypothetical protein
MLVAEQPWLVAARPQIFDVLFVSLIVMAISEAQVEKRRMMHHIVLSQ